VDQLTLALSEVVLRKFASDDQPTAAADPPPTTDDELAACVYEPSYTPKASRLGRRALVAFAIAGALVLGVRSDESDSGIVAPAHEVVAP
jgi:hypothetical protein